MPDLSGVWRFDTSQVIAAPASGYLRGNASPATRLAVSATTKGGADVHADLAALTNGATLIAQEVSDATAAAKWQLTGAVIDHTSWVELPVAVIVYAPAVQPPHPNQDLLLTGYAAAAHAPYGDVTELARRLKIDTPTAAQTAAMQVCLEAAASEIDWELDYTPDTPAPSPVPALVVEVNYQRAVEHWQKGQPPFVGIASVGGEAFPLFTRGNSWFLIYRPKLWPLKQKFGIA